MGKSITIDNIEYYFRYAPRGYGYEIIKREPIEDNKVKRTLYFSSYNIKLIKDIFFKMEDNQKLPDVLPDTSNEIPPPKVLVFDTKHFRYYYFVDTPEKLRKTCIKILKERVGERYYYKPEEPQNYSGIDSLDELDTIPDKFKGLTNEIQTKFKNYQREVIMYKSAMVDWNDLQRILDDEDLSVGFVWNVISEFEPESITLTDMDVVE